MAQEHGCALQQPGSRIGGLKIAVLTSFAPSITNFRGWLLKRLVERGHQVLVTAPGADERLRSEIHALGVIYFDLPLNRRGISPFSDILYMRRACSLLREQQVELVFSYTVKPVIYGSFAARIAGIKSIYSLITGLGYTFAAQGLKGRFLNQITRNLYRVALRSNRMVFFQNPDDFQLFVCSGILESHRGCVVNGSGVDLHKFTEEPLPSGPPVFLLIARLLRAKGILEFSQAAAEVKKVHPEARFVLIGPSEPGPDSLSERDLEPWIRTRTIEYQGPVEDVRPAIRSSTVFVLPSYREGTPRSVLEAMACGRPIVTTTAPGCRQTVIEGFNGYLVPPRDSKALADIFLKFLDDPELARRMGPNSRKLAVEKFDVHEVNRVLLDKMGLS